MSGRHGIMDQHKAERRRDRKSRSRAAAAATAGYCTGTPETSAGSSTAMTPDAA